MAKAKVNIKVTDALTPTSNDLCCKVNWDYKCAFCKHVMCHECAKPWSGRQHFILDMCRKRFTYTQQKKAVACFKKRQVAGRAAYPTLGDCYVCETRKKRLFDFDYELDRIPLHTKRHKV